MSGARVLLLDYGVGNLLSVGRALAAAGGEVEQTGDPGRVDKAARLLLPGVGAFGGCMGELRKRGLDAPVVRFARSGRPLLGICVGMQIMFEAGEEFGRHEGLGLLAGTVRAIPPTGADGMPHKIPHIGWNALKPAGLPWAGTVLEDVAPGESVYFVHSYAAESARKPLAVADYDGRSIIASVAGDGQMSTCQFHPEKSGPVGLRILRKFLTLKS